jgi:hypothetical protein
MSIFTKMRNAMSDFLNNIETLIGGIHTNHGVDNATVTAEISDAVKAGVQPLQDQINDLQKALTDTLIHLADGQVGAATATAALATGSTPENALISASIAAAATVTAVQAASSPALIAAAETVAPAAAEDTITATDGSNSIEPAHVED